MTMRQVLRVAFAGAAIALGVGDAAGAVDLAKLPAVPPYAKFADGLLSRTKPQGWLQTFCARQRTGLTGHPEAMGYPYNSCLWAGAIPRDGSYGAGWWRYEQTAYYVDGLLRLGYVLDDPKLIATGETNIQYVLDHASPEGYLGHPCLWDTKNHKIEKGCLTWPMSVFFRAMKARYENAPDARIPEALKRYFLNFTSEQLARGRNVISVEGLLWTYSLTGEKRLLELAEEAWLRTRPKGKRTASFIDPDSCTNSATVCLHGVTYCETLKVPALLAAYTGKREYFQQGIGLQKKLVKENMLPSGCTSSTEGTQGNSVYRGHETCDIVDFSWSVGYLLEATGDAHYADEIERCTFNAGPGAITKDFKALQYFSNVNQFTATGSSDPNPFVYGGMWQQYRTSHRVECCAGNINRLMPNYVSRMWMRDKAGDPVAALYGPSEVDYGFVKIQEKTTYPFDGKIRFVLTLPETKEFSFTYRVPVWCTTGVTLSVNGEAESAVAAAGTFGSLRRTFKTGDVIELNLPMEVRFEEIPPVLEYFRIAGSFYGRRQTGKGSQGTVVARGPLVYSYPIPTDCTIDEKPYNKNLQSKKSQNPEFKCLSMTPCGAFNFALAAHEAKVVATSKTGYAFDLAQVPVKIEVPVRRVEWNLLNGRITPPMPKKPLVPVSKKVEKILLVPYGATCLRVTVFPELPTPQEDFATHKTTGGKSNGN